MNYQPKVVRCRLHTGGKSIQEIRERYTGQAAAGTVHGDDTQYKINVDESTGEIINFPGEAEGAE